ncbi:hypothetical protein HPB52_009118 [Rhipicephalus sanguineus]|uniref:Uncharacterized protein n=1 Tax=Rhipicephalus sanguineus TaxID=34632 RepID=A0A9D4YMK2_RHISA|nr:hypothetical protein HPB52_009118 [Rhipicephalus sanguineus]
MARGARPGDITELSGDIINLVIKGEKAFARYVDADTAATNLKLLEKEVGNGKVTRVEKCTSHETETQDNLLDVFRVPFECTVSRLKELFPGAKVYVLNDGFARLHFESSEDLLNAVQNPACHTIDGSSIRFSLVKKFGQATMYQLSFDSCNIWQQVADLIACASKPPNVVDVAQHVHSVTLAIEHRLDAIKDFCDLKVPLVVALGVEISLEVATPGEDEVEIPMAVDEEVAAEAAAAAGAITAGVAAVAVGAGAAVAAVGAVVGVGAVEGASSAEAEEILVAVVDEGVEDASEAVVEAAAGAGEAAGDVLGGL